MKSQFFIKDHKLGILVPHLALEWEQYTYNEQQKIICEWENIRGNIPDRIRELEQQINKKQERLDIEDDFDISCRLNSEIAELASKINDLWLLYRTNQDLSTKPHQ